MVSTNLDQLLFSLKSELSAFQMQLLARVLDRDMDGALNLSRDTMDKLEGILMALYDHYDALEEEERGS